MAKYPKNLLTLISQLKKFPGVGGKTAERFAFSLIQWNENALLELSKNIGQLKKNILTCTKCGCLMDSQYCQFCDDASRNKEIICIISSPRDAYAIEETNMYKGLYHVIKNLLSPLNGFDENELNLDQLKKRIDINNVKEVVVALDSTVEGDATSLFLKEQISRWNISISRLAFGIPVGSSLEYIDEGTLSRAFEGRQIL